MRLLLVTQAVDRDDPVLGFFHRWISEFASQYEEVHVIAQRTGAYDLPENVTVYSLGKERGATRMGQVLKFWRLLFWLGGRYDAALVHMTPVWVVLGRRLWSAPVYLWYEARGGGRMLKRAVKKAKKVFSASQRGMPLSTAKSVIVGHGIDIALFCPEGARADDLLVSVGRVTASKRLPVLLRCLSELPAQYRLHVAGGPVTAQDQAYHIQLQHDAVKYGLRDRVSMAPVPQAEVVTLLQSATLFLHASETALDKALLEAMATACPVLSCADVAEGLLPPECACSPDAMGGKAKELLSLPAGERQKLGRKLREIVERDHSLPRLVRRLREEMSPTGQ